MAKCNIHTHHSLMHVYSYIHTLSLYPLVPLMSGGPWMVVSISLVYVLFCTVIGPAIMRNRPPFDLRFWIIHYNSILIGVNGIGTVICLWITNYGIDTWNCTQHKPDVNNYKETLMVYLGFMFVVTKVGRKTHRTCRL